MEKFMDLRLFRQLRSRPEEASPEFQAKEHLGHALRQSFLNDYRFRTGQQVGDYIIDFVCFKALLVVEIDNRLYFESDNDRQRREWLRQVGFRVLHFWNNDVLHDVESVLQQIAISLRE